MNPSKTHRLRPVFFSLAIILSLLQWQAAWALPKTQEEFFEQHDADPAKFMALFEPHSNEEIIDWLDTPLEGNRVPVEEATPFNLIHYCTEEVIFFFIKKGLDITTIKPNGWPLLFSMIVRKHFNVVRYFLKHGVDPEIQDSYGKTALYHAIYSGNIEIVELLLEHGASYSQVIADQEELLFSVAAAGDTEMVKFLLENKANTERQDKISPLSIASYNGYIEIVQLLLDHGADPNAGPVPSLLHATDPDVIALLLKYGATPVEPSEPVLPPAEDQPDEPAAVATTDPDLPINEAPDLTAIETETETSEIPPLSEELGELSLNENAPNENATTTETVPSINLGVGLMGLVPQASQ